MKIYRRYKQKISSNQSGFTIIESLVAIIVAGILMTAIAPTIVLSVATRVQAKRVESAVDASKSYIDGVRSGTIEPPKLPNKSEAELKTYNFSKYDAPKQGNLNCKNNEYCTSPDDNLYCVDGDADGSCSITSSKDMIVQAFRHSPSSTDPKDGYSLGVRVYRADAFDKSKVKELKALKDKDPKNKNENYTKQSTFTGGTGLRSVQTPLMEMTTEISKDTTFSNFCDRLKNDDNNGKSKNKDSKC
ncbi:MAG: hormogonium polysaccharide secretion pseudopilin HpsB [Nostocales cyanobacterium 94392]|nr:hormogonium polysaccharide secretion pseudopilin HpsB [Nostocales cyanobacterium 94392]